MALPAELAQAIERETARFAPGELRRATEELSCRYRGEQSRGSQLVVSPVERAGYLATRLPATFVAISAVLREVRERVPGFTPQSLLDLGAGPGTAAWAVAESFPEIERMVLVERDSAMIASGKALAASASHAALRSAEWVAADLADFHAKEDFDLVILAYALGEVKPSRRATAVERAWVAGKVLAIIGPGTPTGFASILQARTQLIAAGVQLVAPCPHEDECPMRGSARDWCHFSQRLERSKLHRRLKSGELGYEDEKFSYVVASKLPARKAAARIVRHPTVRKGHIELQLCAPDGLRSETVTRSLGEEYKRARKAKWGEEWG